MATKKVEVTEISPREVRKGEIILLKGTQMPEAVRSIEVVLNMANGQALVYDVSEKVEKVTNPDEAGYADVIKVLPPSEEDNRPVEVLVIEKTREA